MKSVKLNSMGGTGKETLRALIRERPEEAELTPITEDEFWGAFRTAHRDGQTAPELDSMAEALDRAEAQLGNVAAVTAAERRQMAAEVFALMLNDSDGVLTPDEIREVWTEARYHEWATDNGDGTFTLTEAGRQIIAASQKR